MEFALGPKAVAADYRVAAYETIGSTSTEALARGRAGDLGRLWIVAGEQTAGHGRRGRPWQTPAGNLAASLLLRVPEPSASLGFAAGLAVHSAITALAERRFRKLPPPLWGRAGEGVVLRTPEAGDLPAAPAQHAAVVMKPISNPLPHPLPTRGRGAGLRLKWPNDVLIDGAKVAGLLLEALTGGGGTGFVVIGFGVNVRYSPQGVPHPATSLATEGIDVTADHVFAALSDAWVDHEILWNSDRGFGRIRERWLQHAAGVGAPIAVSTGEAFVRGIFETIDENGHLVVRTADGRAHRVSAGEVHFGAAATVDA
jgi:BirA family biotin operon repressor/biotin-[acetyl-CoA-carboxylase] ligase